MEFVIVIGAALASYVFGAVWYMLLARPWMKAAGIVPDENGRPPNAGPAPYIIAFLAACIVAGMMRHVFSLSGIGTMPAGAVAGFGIGAFLVAPWIATNYGFAGKPHRLFLIDAGYAVFGCTIMGLVLTLF